LSFDGSDFQKNNIPEWRQGEMHRVPHQSRGNIFVVVTVIFPAPSMSFQAMKGCRAFISIGRRREASEMISRQRVTA
jgi:hypothetical protein